MRFTQFTILAAICLFSVVQGDDFFEMLFGKKPLKGKLGESSASPDPEESAISSKTEVTTATVESTDAAGAADATVAPEADATDA